MILNVISLASNKDFAIMQYDSIENTWFNLL